MLISDVSSDSPLNLISQRATAKPAAGSIAQEDSTLDGLSLTSPLEETGGGIEDEAGANQVIGLLEAGMMQQPGEAFAAQANQMSQNLLGLLPTVD